ncbi:ribonuclease D [Streptomyces sp. NBC_01089]|uniref:ribonuclease D n=1 Tax=Streptomyces sp. NBC_01089 TaxID=2903747 RepID=UPI003864EC97|nr:ribonuclease D [Streptomyces sp. NBC_01089]
MADDVQVLTGDISSEIYRAIVAAGRLAWDIETNGLDPQAARIGTCQLSAPTVRTVVVTGLAGEVPPNLRRLLADERVLKVFHHAPFDLSFMAAAWNVTAERVACTKIAAKLLAPRAAKGEYSLKHLMAKSFGLELDKSVRFTDWLADDLTQQQVEYAVMDVVKLLDLYDILRGRLDSRGLLDLYDRCCAFLPAHVELRLHGVADPFKY